MSHAHDSSGLVLCPVSLCRTVAVWPLCAVKVATSLLFTRRPASRASVSTRRMAG
jgi:hypothetical protein